jgi:hypothetical protein
MEIFYPVNRVFGDFDLNPHLPIDEIRELNHQMNCNLESSEEGEIWFDQESDLEMIRVIDEQEFLKDI